MSHVNQVAVLALDGLAQRQQVIAHNLANLNTPGYTPLHLDFESVVNDMATHGVSRQRTTFALYPQGKPASANLENRHALLNRQVALLSDTVLRYQTLVQGLNQQLAWMQLAVSEGKRG